MVTSSPDLSTSLETAKLASTAGSGCVQNEWTLTRAIKNHLSWGKGLAPVFNGRGSGKHHRYGNLSFTFAVMLGVCFSGPRKREMQPPREYRESLE